MNGFLRNKFWIYVSFVSLTEVYYITAREKSEKVAKERMKQLHALQLKIVESYYEMNIAAGEIKSKNKLSFADAFVAALGKEKNATIIHKDPEYEKVAPAIKQWNLPYKV